LGALIKIKIKIPMNSSMIEQPDGNMDPVGGAPVQHGKLMDILSKARAIKASDLHITVGRPIFLRLNGGLRFADESLSAAETEALLFEILTEDQKNELRKELNLEFSLVDDSGSRYRGIIIHHRLGWDGVFRVINNEVMDFEELGLPENLARLTEYQQGLVLVGGPSGSGKTSTLAALLDRINQTRQDHIITVEDPIEYIIRPKRCQVTQREVGSHTRSFSYALRAALREDPDVIMVGEMRDLETMSMAITAAETGHLVLSSIHTTSATRTIGALIDAFPPGRQDQIRMMVAESLRGIICQYLVPSMDGMACYPAMEILFSNPGIASIIRENRTHMLTSEIQTGKKQGMRLMDDSLDELVREGKVSQAEAHKWALDRERFG
jgi:twitching motility protein PilT